MARRIGSRALECRSAGTLCLTYDDGPGPQLTPRVLDLLAAYSVTATFFVLGARAERTPELVEQVRVRGHEIGCHTHSHRNAWRSSPWSVSADIAAGYASLSRWVAPNGIFRPPYGRLTPLSWLSLKRRGAPIGWWTIDSGDTHDPLPDPLRVVDRVRNSRGGVVLLHDFDRGSADSEPRQS